MDIFDKIGKKTTETYQAAKDKTVKVTSELKLKAQINDAQNKIDELYLDLGQLIYTKRPTGDILADEEVQEIFNKIKEQEIRKKDAMDAIKKLNNIKICYNCSAEIPVEAAFCPKCGKEQPVEAEIVTGDN